MGWMCLVPRDTASKEAPHIEKKRDSNGVKKIGRTWTVLWSERVESSVHVFVSAIAVRLGFARRAETLVVGRLLAVFATI